jgi:hypothetical protein
LPDLEAALYEWQQHMQKKNAVITGDILQEQAAKLWNSLPQYQNRKQPKFSNGWLGGFKNRFKIKEYVKHGEEGSAEIDKPDAVQQMETVRTLAAKYDPDNTLNMDEIGLFWKLAPDRTLVTKPGSGGKKSKDRITVAFTCSASGKKEEPWVVDLIASCSLVYSVRCARSCSLMSRSCVVMAVISCWSVKRRDTLTRRRRVDSI